MAKIGRPRKAHALRKENISVNLPKTLVSEIESQLSYKSSRSEWVQLAIEEKLGEKYTVNESTSIQLMAALIARQEISEFTIKVLHSEIKSMMQVVETVEEQ
jgi:metal-responsive CopG/Arc/MetJ family transcriptional regulator